MQVSRTFDDDFQLNVSRALFENKWSCHKIWQENPPTYCDQLIKEIAGFVKTECWCHWIYNTFGFICIGHVLHSFEKQIHKMYEPKENQANLKRVQSSSKIKALSQAGIVHIENHSISIQEPWEPRLLLRWNCWAEIAAAWLTRIVSIDHLALLT